MSPEQVPLADHLPRLPARSAIVAFALGGILLASLAIRILVEGDCRSN